MIFSILIIRSRPEVFCKKGVFKKFAKFTGKSLYWVTFCRAKDCSFIKACVRYFHQFFIFSPNDSPSKTLKNAFYFFKKALFVYEIFKFFCISAPPSFTCRPLLCNVSICLSKNSITHFVWYPEKEKRYNIETLCIDGVSDNEHFYRKIMQKMSSKS